MGISNSRAASNRRLILAGIRGGGTTGDVFYVDSGNSGAADTAGRGRTPTVPFATVDFAVGQCAASNGDVIIVMPGHAETISGALGLVIDVVGVTIVGLGIGNIRPTFTLSATLSRITMSATDCRIENCIFTTGTADSTQNITIIADRCQVVDCKFLNAASFECTAGLLVGEANNDADDTLISGCEFFAIAVGSAQAIHLAQVQDGVIIEDCHFVGEWSVAPIHNPTGEILTDLTIRRCFCRNDTTAQLGIELISACTGQLIDNYISTDVAGVGGLDPGSCDCFENYTDDQEVDTSAILAPVAGA